MLFFPELRAQQEDEEKRRHEETLRSLGLPTPEEEIKYNVLRDTALQYTRANIAHQLTTEWSQQSPVETSDGHVLVKGKYAYVLPSGNVELVDPKYASVLEAQGNRRATVDQIQEAQRRLDVHGSPGGVFLKSFANANAGGIPDIVANITSSADREKRERLRGELAQSGELTPEARGNLDTRQDYFFRPQKSGSVFDMFRSGIGVSKGPPILRRHEGYDPRFPTISEAAAPGATDEQAAKYEQGVQAKLGAPLTVAEAYLKDRQLGKQERPGYDLGGEAAAFLTPYGGMSTAVGRAGEHVAEAVAESQFGRWLTRMGSKAQRSMAAGKGGAGALLASQSVLGAAAGGSRALSEGLLIGAQQTADRVALADRPLGWEAVASSFGHDAVMAGVGGAMGAALGLAGGAMKAVKLAREPQQIMRATSNLNRAGWGSEVEQAQREVVDAQEARRREWLELAMPDAPPPDTAAAVANDPLVRQAQKRVEAVKVANLSQEGFATSANHAGEAENALNELMPMALREQTRRMAQAGLSKAEIAEARELIRDAMDSGWGSFHYQSPEVGMGIRQPDQTKQIFRMRGQHLSKKAEDYVAAGPGESAAVEERQVQKVPYELARPGTSGVADARMRGALGVEGSIWKAPLDYLRSKGISQSEAERIIDAQDFHPHAIVQTNAEAGIKAMHPARGANERMLVDDVFVDPGALRAQAEFLGQKVDVAKRLINDEVATGQVVRGADGLPKLKAEPFQSIPTTKPAAPGVGKPIDAPQLMEWGLRKHVMTAKSIDEFLQGALDAARELDGMKLREAQKASQMISDRVYTYVAETTRAQAAMRTMRAPAPELLGPAEEALQKARTAASPPAPEPEFGYARSRPAHEGILRVAGDAEPAASPGSVDRYLSDIQASRGAPTGTTEALRGRPPTAEYGPLGGDRIPSQMAFDNLGNVEAATSRLTRSKADALVDEVQRIRSRKPAPPTSVLGKVLGDLGEGDVFNLMRRGAGQFVDRPYLHPNERGIANLTARAAAYYAGIAATKAIGSALDAPSAATWVGGWVVGRLATRLVDKRLQPMVERFAANTARRIRNAILVAGDPKAKPQTLNQLMSRPMVANDDEDDDD